MEILLYLAVTILYLILMKIQCFYFRKGISLVDDVLTTKTILEICDIS